MRTISGMGEGLVSATPSTGHSEFLLLAMKKERTHERKYYTQQHQQF
jgi:hypothetical protein